MTGHFQSSFHFVIYHGKDNWNVANSLSDLIKGYNTLPSDLQSLVPNFKYLLYDFSERTDEEIKGDAKLKIYQMIVQEITNPNHQSLLHVLIKALKYLEELESKEKGIEYLETMMRYVFSVGENLTEKEVQQVMEQLENTYPEGSEVIMTLAERYMAKGKAEGIEKGKTEALVGATIQLLSKRFGEIPEELKEDISRLEITTLENVMENILEFKHMDDVRKYIG